MGTGPDRVAFPQFLDDYYAECDEHLSEVKRLLLEVESSGDVAGLSDKDVLGELLRRFHTVKGLSMMVGFAEVGELAHEVESALRAASARSESLHLGAVHALADAVGLVERAIASQKHGARTKSTRSDMQTIVAPLAGSSAEQVSSRASGSEARGVQPAGSEVGSLRREGRERALRFQFVPDKALLARGIGVDAVRKALAEEGRILRSEPVVRSGGTIAFAFTVATTADDKSLAPLSSLGLTWESAVGEQLTDAAPGAPGEESRVTALAPSNMVRVDLGRLNELMRLCGELVVTRSRLEDSLDGVRARVDAKDWRLLMEMNEVLERQIRSLREGVMRVRMVPIGEVFERMRFAAHELAREQGKTVEVALTGEETEIDKLVVERVLDPLLHLVRNAVTHGIETPGQRKGAGKEPAGRLTLSASAVGQAVHVSVSDDGRGIDLTQVSITAAAMGLIDPEESLEPERLLEVISRSGFSTLRDADLSGGRGVGMVIVKQAVADLGGEVFLSTSVGIGSQFSLHLPISLAIVESLIVESGGQRYAIALQSVREVLEVRMEEVVRFEGGEMIPHREGVLPLVHLADVFHLPEPTRAVRHVLVLPSGSQSIGLVVDKVIEQREIVVNAIVDPLARVPGVGGATELGDGTVVLILDAARLSRIEHRRPRELMHFVGGGGAGEG